MARDIRDFSKNYDKTKKNKDPKDMKRDDLDDKGKQDYDSVMNRAKQFEGKSEDQLMNELFKRVSDGKKNGTLNNADIDKFASQVAPMLSGEQRKKLQQLISMIK